MYGKLTGTMGGWVSGLKVTSFRRAFPPYGSLEIVWQHCNLWNEHSLPLQRVDSGGCSVVMDQVALQLVF